MERCTTRHRAAAQAPGRRPRCSSAAPGPSCRPHGPDPAPEPAAAADRRPTPRRRAQSRPCPDRQHSDVRWADGAETGGRSWPRRRPGSGVAAARGPPGPGPASADSRGSPEPGAALQSSHRSGCPGGGSTGRCAHRRRWAPGPAGHRPGNRRPIQASRWGAHQASRDQNPGQHWLDMGWPPT